METRAIPLDQLHFGHEADPPLNARKIGREDEVESLAASINAHGLGQALNVKEIDGEFFVTDGNRRLAALRLNASKGLTAADAPIDCRVGEGDDELSLALNIERVPMHEADQYEKFHELHSRGLTEEQIASRFGIELVRVRRFIALGRLHPVILAAWRNDEFQQPAAIVRAFTMAPSQKAQKEVFDRLNKQGYLHPHGIREAFGAGNQEASKLLTFVGRDAYLAAGGKIVEDLFGDDHAISDFDLVKRLTDERIERECTALEVDGWAWAQVAASLPQSWNWNWQKVNPKLQDPTKEEASEIKKLEKMIGKTAPYERTEAQIEASEKWSALKEAIKVRSFTPKDKKKSGAAVSIASDGSLHVTYGVVKPSAPKKEKPKAGEPAAPSTISNAVMERLSVQLTAAAKGAIVDHPHTALAALVAGMACATYGIPVRVRAEGLLKEGREVESFSTVFGRLCAMSDADLMKAAAHKVSFCLDMQTHNAASPPLANATNAAFCEALDVGSSLQAALTARFDAEDYFKSVPRSFTVAAIGEAINADEARRAEKLKKPEMVAFAVKNVPPTGWLPVELRTSGYAGPGAVERKKAA